MAIALVNLSYGMWCLKTDTPAHPLSKLVTPLVLVGAVILARSRTSVGD